MFSMRIRKIYIQNEHCLRTLSDSPFTLCSCCAPAVPLLCPYFALAMAMPVLGDVDSATLLDGFGSLRNAELGATIVARDLSRLAG